VKWTRIVLSLRPLSFSVIYCLFYSRLSRLSRSEVREACCCYIPKPASCEFHGRLSLFAAYSRFICCLRSPQEPPFSLHIRSDSFTAWQRASSLQTFFSDHMQCITGIFLFHCVHCRPNLEYLFRFFLSEKRRRLIFFGELTKKCPSPGRRKGACLCCMMPMTPTRNQTNIAVFHCL